MRAHVPDLLLAPLESARGMLRNDHLEVGVEGGLDAVHVPMVHRVDEAQHCVHSIASDHGFRPVQIAVLARCERFVDSVPMWTNRAGSVIRSAPAGQPAASRKIPDALQALRTT
jgi:hypothetical protein